MTDTVVIIGGGIIGSAAAFFLARAGADVMVVEADSTYAKATSPQGAGGVRQQFSVPENIEQSLFSIDFYRNFKRHMNGVPDLPNLDFREQGYLFVVGADGEDTLRANAARQRSMGVTTQLMDRDALRRKFPSILRDDITLACHTPDDGWVDPNAALWGFRRAALHHGAIYKEARVSAIETTAHKAEAVILSNGDRIEAGYVVNCAGPWVNDIAQMTGASLPVAPMCRVQHFWHCPKPMEALPLVKDESGLFFRPEGDGFAGGRPSFEIDPGFVDDIYRGFFANYFENTVWPMLAALVPSFESLRLKRSWAGHYAQNLLDGNMIIGPYSERHENLITACGFSGHGLMHAPAVGRAISELVLHGAYQSIDLSGLGMVRVQRNEPYPEIGIT
ncbi:FAD-binding oxidoreductase [Roseovarius sp. SCSIO 43702]|uniref:NAD(P)/FAD-dependent oxidoreductase n=1 Tax=Roseovarius sp. SCSIO 43702 TaxID=2823043 RepID=UPI001C73C692|nr:FAD-dependent oxidoreductase [Roseovarius sp. SCSIO 43702]QYX56859.1 FAD-binding oxidoreductase [Roseovarius sp. SCSIO 43702]